MATAKEPRPGSRFALKIDGHEQVGVFRECSGMDSETEVTEHKAVDAKGQLFVRKVPGATKWSNITLKRGVDTELTLWKWRDEVLTHGPDKARVDGTITLLDYDGSTILAYKFLQGWPLKYGGFALNASTNEIALEEVVICHEGLKREV
jgi:phage tail-like protein